MRTVNVEPRRRNGEREHRTFNIERPTLNKREETLGMAWSMARFGEDERRTVNIERPTLNRREEMAKTNVEQSTSNVQR
jgi:hypothetical protein